jgi:hypothetical protein
MGKPGAPNFSPSPHVVFGLSITIDILRAASGEGSYGASFWRGLFGGFLPQPPYCSGGLRRGLLAMPGHRSCGRQGFQNERKGKNAGGLYIPGLKRRGFTARLG